ncbi:hypothetical protein CYMTET_41882 [Cymbomonas tetramitiformis]|uniref:Uncharacterized protein n=1 Tax=Cymbomonas tetramitiformis TaxID=36881 RepID=A0AAE0C5A8_9CHLO|nr:hypothetical protein CYMTET_41882 [Cymbomonas tetramitiformis]
MLGRAFPSVCKDLLELEVLEQEEYARCKRSLLNSTVVITTVQPEHASTQHATSVPENSRPSALASKSGTADYSSSDEDYAPSLVDEDSDSESEAESDLGEDNDSAGEELAEVNEDSDVLDIEGPSSEPVAAPFYKPLVGKKFKAPTFFDMGFKATVTVKATGKK